jgi:hypothetical protein
MTGYEYKVIPAPTKGVKAKGVRTAEARFSYALEGLMNEMGAEGWEFQRAETLPGVERSGLTGSQTVWRHVLVFRRPRAAVAAEAPEPEVEPLKIEHKQDDSEHPAGQPGATRMLKDNGVEETSEVSGPSLSLSALVASRRKPGEKKPDDSDV